MTAALDLFARSGYGATSVSDICKTVNISKGAFYHHFPSKQSLFMALMQDWLDLLDEGFNAVKESSENIPDALFNMAGMTGQIFEAANSGFPIIIEFWRQANSDPIIWKEAVTPYERYLNYFEGLILDGITEGSLDKSVDPKIAARLLLSLAMGFLLQASFDPNGASWTEVTQSGMRLLINGMRRSE
ncbi:MAG: TetR/AcrR family transcriptional regulator [Anaerolineaceae bacterium]|nr:TetR/AcrR family transcriptional regulator [Anaerolineaceae bacterium]